MGTIFCNDQLFFSCIYLIFIGLTSAFFFWGALFIWLVTLLFDRRLVILHLYTSFWAYFYVWCMPAWSVTIKGKEKLNWNKQYIIVSNHQSQLDILVAFGLFFPFKWVSKLEVFKLPFIGWNMYLNRYISLKRGDKESIRKMMSDCERQIQKGCSIYMFPEGTRSKDGVLRPFKPGAFILAKQNNLPILPVVINGTMQALPKHSLVLQKNHRISIIILDEIPVETIQSMEPEEMALNVRALIDTHLFNASENL
ncbi:lysophospholipid acyltransferase family protein [Desulfamplus magnetovallimortis]|uniref:lysophospholipid acyltransferase family protein n=1 Tax=Desulfamplus magnetovallimortis TaxID=1246637 RepID=UPI001FE42AFD|nr:lysophospholipid acyltransferase family protein [Desulfamplus magnetovallimortis]